LLSFELDDELLSFELDDSLEVEVLESDGDLLSLASLALSAGAFGLP
jgi:hypothetical protein